MRELAELKPREFLLLASYCGDSKECTDRRPCPACLDMCNVFTITAEGTLIYERELGQIALLRAKEAG